jgi:hypothetical protein|nr:type II toxin-antitoxin system RelE/ParE family toxin [uncultured Lachnoanaerobaculum sp.]
MDYKIILMQNAENDYDSFITYLLFKKKSEQATISLLNDFEATKVSLPNVARSIKICDNPKLRELGYRRINFFLIDILGFIVLRTILFMDITFVVERNYIW